MVLCELAARFDSRKSFYGKAQVAQDENDSILYSYNTQVAKVDKNGKLTLFPAWNYSQTTRRHVNEFVKQMGVDDQLQQMKKRMKKEKV